MPVVTVAAIHKAFGAHVVVRSADLTIATGERVGMVGKNGAGKTTLARIVAGVDTADSGTVTRRRGATVRYLSQVPRFDGDPTATEAVAQGLGAWTHALERHAEFSERLARGDGEQDALLGEQAAAADEVERLGGFEQSHRIASMLDHLGVRRTDARISTLSGGEQRRVALATILVARPDLAVLDEPTNHLDADTVEWLEQYLVNEHPGAVLLVTHDRYLLDRVAQRTVEVAGGEAHAYAGGYEMYLEQKAERLAHAARTEANRQNFLRRELEWLRRQPKARTTKQKARVERAEAALSVQGPKTDRAPSFELSVSRAGKTILELRDVEVRMREQRLVNGLTLFLTAGERVGVLGPNGSGKTTLLRTLLGEIEPAAGSVVLGQNTRVAYFDQGRSGLEDDKSVFENVVGDQSRIEIAGEVVEPRSFMERFGLDSGKQRQPVASLSGGERARVALARLLRQSANLVILDEPTNDLDVETLAAVEGMLIDSGVTAVVVTHDRYFLDRVATSILAFEGDGKVVHYPGNYTTFRRLREEANRDKKAPAEAEAKAERRRPTSKKKGLSHTEAKELDGIMEVIEAAEARVVELSEALSDPNTYAAGGGDAARLTAELDAARVEVERLTARWEELETKRDQ
ncbi:MAG: ABC-F family ATP-binding cassette domain-containing protein [Polyangiaceae bacterium]|nr:ABC-F family ATP-binding cassette domain-containing protein [Polyangiaceae bacterium]